MPSTVRRHKQPRGILKKNSKYSSRSIFGTPTAAAAAAASADGYLYITRHFHSSPYGKQRHKSVRFVDDIDKTNLSQLLLRRTQDHQAGAIHTMRDIKPVPLVTEQKFSIRDSPNTIKPADEITRFQSNVNNKAYASHANAANDQRNLRITTYGGDLLQPYKNKETTTGTLVKPMGSLSLSQGLAARHHLRDTHAVASNPAVFKKRINKSKSRHKQRHDVYNANNVITRLVSKHDPSTLAQTRRGVKTMKTIARIQQAERINNSLAGHIVATEQARKVTRTNRSKSSHSKHRHKKRRSSSSSSSSNDATHKYSSGGKSKPLVKSSGPSGATFTVRASGARQYYHHK